MKKNHSVSDDAGAFPSFDDGTDAAMPAPVATDNPLFVDEDGDSYSFASAAVVINASTVTNKPVATISALADYLINGFWQYNSAIAHHWASSTITYNIGGLNAAEQFLAQSALQAWHEVANVTFVQTTGAANITFSDAGSMQAVTNASWYSNGAMASANVDISADWITNDGGAMDGKTGIDSYGYQTYIHEIGHALGLGHQGPYNGSAVYSSNALYADDTWQYSVMSYFSENNYSGSTYRYVVSPQMADVYAVGEIYGAATTTRTGDTVYGFHGNAGSVYNFSAYSQAPAFTIYDSGGNDTLDCSGYSAAQTIDLHAGAFSSVGGLVNNIGIALGATIENAIGGSGNDRLVANDSGCSLSGGAGNDTLVGGAGNDRLIGGAGVDTMTGNGGADTFVFATGDSSAASGQHDRITDFIAGADHIDLSGIDAISGTAGVDQFHFIGSSAFDGSAGELDYFYNSTLGVTVVQGDTNGDHVADFAIDLVGNLTLGLSSFIGVYSLPVVIEAVGSTSLLAYGSSFSFNPVGGGTGPQLKYGGSVVTAGEFGAFTPIGAEAITSGGTVTGYEVAWKAAGADQYMVWHTDSNGNFTANIINATSGSDTALQSIETSFHQDLNGDGVIGVPVSTVIEAIGVTSLVQTGVHYFLDSIGTGIGPELKHDGMPLVAGQNGDWAPFAAEATAGGYDVAWKDSVTGQYSVWSTDSNGNYISEFTGVVSGNDTSLKMLETTFHQDLNGDGVTGAATIAVESFGSTSLVQVGNNYFLDSISTGAGPELKHGGTPVAAGQNGDWAPFATEATASGYDVAWKDSVSGQYSVWSTDSNGNYISEFTGVVSGSDAGLKALETTFHQDLNGDGVIGSAAVTVESFGSTSLVQAGGNYFLESAGVGPELKHDGTPVVAGQNGDWAPFATEATASGYDVAWKDSVSGQYSVWSTDSNGNYISEFTGVVSGNDTSLKVLETTFHQDLNGDGVIGVAAVTVESFGSTSLVQSGSDYFLNSNSTGAGPELKHGGTPVVAGQYADWTPIAAEATPGGYDVAWKDLVSGQYSVWSTDSNGNYISEFTGVVSGTDAGFQSLETTFHQDLNGDGVIGLGLHNGSFFH